MKGGENPEMCQCYYMQLAAEEEEDELEGEKGTQERNSW